MVNSLVLATVLRIVLIILSYGAKVPAGIFVPSMAVGATFGRMVGILVKATYRCVFLLGVNSALRVVRLHAE
jgi:chloride channel 3/4/5